jgi:hypothetical protein
VRAGWRCLLVIVGFFGCAGDLENPERFEFLLDKKGSPLLDPCAVELFNERCIACHAQNSQQIDLISEGVEMRLIGAVSETKECDGHTLVAKDGGDSLLVDKLKADPPCGLRMPLGEPLSDTEISCVEGWVTKVQAASGGGS